MSRRALHFRRLGVRFAVAGAALVAAALAFFHGGSVGATTLKTFATPGSYTWKVPTGVTGVTFDVLGARGGSVLQNSGGVVDVISSGGAGGEAKARFAVHAGEVFEIVVGGQGGSFTQGSSGGGGAGGFNGGGGGASSGGGGARRAFASAAAETPAQEAKHTASAIGSSSAAAAEVEPTRQTSTATLAAEPPAAA